MRGYDEESDALLERLLRGVARERFAGVGRGTCPRRRDQRGPLDVGDESLLRVNHPLEESLLDPEGGAVRACGIADRAVLARAVHERVREHARDDRSDRQQDRGAGRGAGAIEREDDLVHRRAAPGPEALGEQGAIPSGLAERARIRTRVEHRLDLRTRLELRDRCEPATTPVLRRSVREEGRGLGRAGSIQHREPGLEPELLAPGERTRRLSAAFGVQGPFSVLRGIALPGREDEDVVRPKHQKKRILHFFFSSRPANDPMSLRAASRTPSIKKDFQAHVKPHPPWLRTKPPPRS